MILIASPSPLAVIAREERPKQSLAYEANFYLSHMFSTKGGFVYIITNENHTVLYTGVTSDLQQRVEQHKNGKFKGSFTSKYNCHKLVYYSGSPYIAAAIAEEKRIKAGNRKNKIKLIESMNPEWKDLWEEISK